MAGSKEEKARFLTEDRKQFLRTYYTSADQLEETDPQLWILLMLLVEDWMVFGSLV